MPQLLARLSVFKRKKWLRCRALRHHEYWVDKKGEVWCVFYCTDICTHKRRHREYLKVSTWSVFISSKRKISSWRHFVTCRIYTGHHHAPSKLTTELWAYLFCLFIERNFLLKSHAWHFGWDHRTTSELRRLHKSLKGR